MHDARLCELTSDAEHGIHVTMKDQNHHSSIIEIRLYGLPSIGKGLTYKINCDQN